VTVPFGVVHAQATVAGEAQAGLGLDGEEAVAVEGYVERVARGLDRALAEVARDAVVQGEPDGVVDLHVAGRPALFGGAEQALHLEARGVRIGDVVGHDVELAAQGHLPRQPDEGRVVHERRIPRPPLGAPFSASGRRSPRAG
jgi:hypothetical protein